jgi:hypothetical protein
MIMLKEAAFAEVKKTVTQERVTFKQLLQQSASDKFSKTQLKLAKKTLLQQVPETSRTDLQGFVQNLIESS